MFDGWAGDRGGAGRTGSWTRTKGCLFVEQMWLTLRAANFILRLTKTVRWGVWHGAQAAGLDGWGGCGLLRYGDAERMRGADPCADAGDHIAR